jgi:two-component system OmpR family sensor kinase
VRRFCFVGSRRSPSITLSILLLLIASLAVAQAVTVIVTVTLPPSLPDLLQRRVAVTFVISLLATAPLGLLVAWRITRPLEAMANAAERLGKDPSSAPAMLEGPAEVGRTAHAVNLMQVRIRRFVEHRVAMVGAVSHDLRTPLARVRFRLERAPREVAEPALRDLGQMEQMIAGVLSFIQNTAHAEAREAADLRSIVECAVDDATLIHGEKVTLRPGPPVSVEADCLAIRRVVANLIDNALKYAGAAEVRVIQRAREALVEVRDEGPGVEPEETEQVFLPFYRSGGSGAQGVGLGLTISRSIARAHGGDVRLMSSKDAGTIAQLRLPALVRANEPCAGHAAINRAA